MVKDKRTQRMYGEGREYTKLVFDRVLRDGGDFSGSSECAMYAEAIAIGIREGRRIEIGIDYLKKAKASRDDPFHDGAFDFLTEVINGLKIKERFSKSNSALSGVAAFFFTDYGIIEAIEFAGISEYMSNKFNERFGSPYRKFLRLQNYINKNKGHS